MLRRAEGGRDARGGVELHLVELAVAHRQRVAREAARARDRERRRRIETSGEQDHGVGHGGDTTPPRRPPALADSRAGPAADAPSGDPSCVYAAAVSVLLDPSAARVGAVGGGRGGRSRALVARLLAERWAALGSTPFPLGIDGYYYPIQLRSLLETGTSRTPPRRSRSG